MLKRILHIDYDALTSYLVGALEGDDRPGPLEFREVSAYLERQVEAMMRFPDEPDSEWVDDRLTDILTANLDMRDHIYRIRLTSTPGIVTHSGEHSLKLPLILIEIE